MKWPARHRHAGRWAVGFVLLVIGAASDASARERKFELTPTVGFRAGGSFSDIDNRRTLDLGEALSYGLILDYSLRENGQIEFLWSRQPTELQSNGAPFPTGRTTLDVNVDYLQFGGLYQWRAATERTRPFIDLTFGLAYYDPTEADLDGEAAFSSSLGGGYKRRLNQAMALRLEGRGHATFLSSSGGFFCTSAGSGATCAAAVDSTVVFQIELLVGLTFGF